MFLTVLWAVLSDLLRHTFSPLLITASVWLMTSAAFLSTEHDESYFLLLLPFCLSVCLWKKLSPWEMGFSDSCLQCIFYKARFFFLISRPIHWKHTSVVQNQSRESKCKTFHLRVSCSSVVLGRSKPCFQPYTFHSEGTGKMTCRQRLTQDAKLEADMKRKLNLI